MGFITSGNTDFTIYLTPLGAQYLTGNKKSANDLIVKYFTLGDSDCNYFVDKRLGKYYVPDLTGEDTSCLKIVNNTVKTTNVSNDFHRSFIYNDTPPPPPVVTYYSGEKTGTAQKNNCTNGTGSIETYTVPANKYTSIISQNDADNKALADVEQNKQINANTKGNCIIPPVVNTTKYIWGKIFLEDEELIAGTFRYVNVVLKSFLGTSETTPPSTLIPHVCTNSNIPMWFTHTENGFSTAKPYSTSMNNDITKRVIVPTNLTVNGKFITGQAGAITYGHYFGQGTNLYPSLASLPEWKLLQIIN